MDRDALKEYIEKAGQDIVSKVTLDDLPEKFYDALIISGVQIEKIEPGRVLCSMKIPLRLVVKYMSILIGSSPYLLL